MGIAGFSGASGTAEALLLVADSLLPRTSGTFAAGLQEAGVTVEDAADAARTAAAAGDSTGSAGLESVEGCFLRQAADCPIPKGIAKMGSTASLACLPGAATWGSRHG
eukprot:2804941-Prymnesium_polylepis.1